MAGQLTPCPDCGQMVSTRATHCPKCGSPLLPVLDVVVPISRQRSKPRDSAASPLKIIGIVAGSIVAVIILLVMLVGIVDSIHQNRLHNNQPPVTDITWEEIDKVYSSGSRLTDLQKDEIWRQYKGQRVRWTGQVDRIDEGIGGIHLFVRMKRTTFTSDVGITLENTERQKALGLRSGDTVTFEATLDSWSTLFSHRLTHGVIVSTAPAQQQNVGQPVQVAKPPPPRVEGAKLAAFRRVVAQLGREPGLYAGQAERQVYANELQQTVRDFGAIPFDPQANRDDAMEIIRIFEGQVKDRYQGTIYNQIEAMVYEIGSGLMQ